MTTPPTQPTTPLERGLQIVSIDFGSTASTVTMFGEFAGTEAPMAPEHVNVVREELAALIASDWPDNQLQHKFVTTALARFPDKARDDRERPKRAQETELGRLVRWLDEEGTANQPANRLLRRDRPETRILSDLWAALAVFFSRHAGVREWGNQQLHAIQRKALSEPALTDSNLTQVTIDEEPQVDSILVVENRDIATGKLSSRPPSAQSLSYRGLKRRVVKPTQLPPELRHDGYKEADSDALVGQAYQFLKDQALKFARQEIGDVRQLPLVVVTYPTTTPPAVRHRLKELVQSKLEAKRVEMAIDEGTAALMFTLMRDFGGNQEAGIQAFRARSRVAGSGQWRQNLLVIDIGGGTTDIALTRLDLRDFTPAVDRAAEAELRSGPDGAASGGPRTRGRVYQLQPEILGTTGHQQYGGDLLTLRVFYWIKARIADEMREGLQADDDLLARWPKGPDGQPRQLAHAIVDYHLPGPGPDDVIRYLRDALPTRSPASSQSHEDYPPQLTPEFLQLWQAALDAKKELAKNDEPHAITAVELDRVTAEWPAQAKALQEIRLSVHDFNRLAKRVLSPAITLAVGLAQRRLALEPRELLDGIALTGRAATMPLVRQLVLDQVAEAFDERGEEDRGRRAPIAWNPALVYAENKHPKGAASIGACWAQSAQENITKTSPRQLAESLPYHTGRDQLIIKVDNIVTHLPCRFGLGTAARPIELFGHGQPLEYADSRAQRFTRTRWLPAQPDIRLLRYLDEKEFILWGRFNIADRFGPVPAGLYYQIEVNDELEPLLHLCFGAEPRLVLDGSNVPIPSQSQMRKSMPWNISVRHQDERSGDQSWKTVIPAIPTVTETTFRQFSVHGASSVSGKDSPVRGVISAELPPPEGIPGAAGASGQLRYTFAGIVPDPRARPDGITAAENAKVEWTVEVPAPQRTTGGPQASYWAVLTETGSLWVAPGYPWYEPATWAGMLDRRGSVFSTAMEMHEAELRTEWDPFTGEH